MQAIDVDSFRRRVLQQNARSLLSAGQQGFIQMMNTVELKEEAVQWHHAAIVNASDDAIIFANLEGVMLACAPTPTARRRTDVGHGFVNNSS
jgi:hypothetical protein